MSSAPRVVLDTNCLISTLIFSRGKFAWLREAWQARRFVPLASHDTVSELLRVLAYPKFKLNHSGQEALLGEYLPHAEPVRVDAAPRDLPAIRDADDIIFLALAAVGRADALVSGDSDIQEVKAQFHIPIFTPSEFAHWLERR